ncbi:cytochrome c oxidase subunit 3 [Phaeocystidibacter luteus]|uniref:Heme-copper oxidase subunit III n=1 Tax=Phaeocystidibacter luteus TaxID=911197 RepID=A0A6N6RIH5_9FLAO|nr:cytochrome c oxidase subunit 3 [Phaeocystidibacter luteus]KAB2813767.1 heme-copper oxidase subunit III [Phaeocystidibacter luteus]
MTDATLKQQRKRAAKPMLWIGIASMVMMFAGLTSGYIVSRSYLMDESGWLMFEIPSIFYVSTAVILASSGTMMLAVKSSRKGDFSATTRWILISVVLGTAFGFLQFFGWNELFNSNIFFAGIQANTAGSWFYVITGFHLLHVVGGWIALIVTAIKSTIGKYTVNDYQGVEMAAIFWHFVDILWVLLLLFLAINR